MKRTLTERIAREEQKIAQLKRDAARATVTLAPVPIVEWIECYDDTWRDYLVDAAFSHPAKAARGLLRQIFTHLYTIGALAKDAIVVDPFGGIGTTGITGAWRGCRVICCELEPKFVELTRENFALHAHGLLTMSLPLPVVVQGDSRQLRAHVRDSIDAIITSPPYSDQGLKGGDQRTALSDPSATDRESKRGKRTASLGHDGPSDYGVTVGQLGIMPSGDVDTIISSPPYAEIASGAGGLNTKPGTDGQQSGRNPSSASQDTDQRYGDTDGQLAKMEKGDVDAIVTSPPYEQAQTGGTEIWKYAEEKHQRTFTDKSKRGGYLANLHGDNTDGNLAITRGDTFWSAARDVVAESYALLKPGGYAAWIVKAFVRDKQLVDFPGDWRKLCEHVGFTTLTEVHALLVKETTETDLFGNETTERVERKSFFRRLAEKKGSPKIDFEVVWIMQRPFVPLGKIRIEVI